jgi:RsiW-degrading membrane proteinase PrsW (M82 family)
MIVIAVAILIATAIPVLALFGMRALDLYKTGEFKFVLICFGAGALAYFAAAFINPLPRRFGWIDYNTMVRFLAPVVEESLKALIIIFMVRRPKFTYFIDGAIYGFATGIGFAIFENYEYILGHSGAALAVAINRVISTNLMHAAACAAVGIVMGWARFKKPFPRIGLSVGGVLLAMTLHMGFNNLVTRVTTGWLLVYAVLVGGGAAGLIALMMRIGFKEEQTSIRETLGVADRVGREEVKAVLNIAKVDDVLKLIAARFGTGKAAQIEKLLLVQARLGILKNNAEKTADEKIRAETLAQIGPLRQEMESARREIGSYAMAYLRYTHLEELFSVYSALGARLQELAAQPRGPGMGVFDRLKEHVVTSQNNQEKQ